MTTTWEEVAKGLESETETGQAARAAKAVMPRDEVIKILLGNGVRKARAAVYADAYLEYQTATANIVEYGMIVKHPRTGNPIENPYLAIRDRAEKKLSRMQYWNSSGLW